MTSLLFSSVVAGSSEISQPVSLLCDAPTYSFEDDFLNSTPPKMIGDLKDCKEVDLFMFICVYYYVL